MASDRLLALPTEILENIARHLGPTDCGQLRASCRRLEAALFPQFGSRFFSHRHFFRSHHSLTVLWDISQSRLSRFVKTVALGTELLPRNLATWAQDGSVDQCRRLFADQRAFLGSGQDRDLLSAAFLRLPNLEALELREFRVSRHHPGLFADDALRFGYGLKSLMHELNVVTTSPFLQGYRQTEFGGQTGAYCLRILFSAAASAKIRLKSFRVIYDKRGTRGLSWGALHIPTFQAEEFVPMIAGLEEIRLDLVQSTTSSDPRDCLTMPLRKFLECTPLIRHLRLQRLDHDEARDGFWRWMAADPSSATDEYGMRWPTQPLPFAHVEELSLGSLNIDLDCLIHLVTKLSATLKRLVLRSVIINQDDEMVVGDPSPPNLWAQLFRSLKACKRLQEVEFTNGFAQGHENGYNTVLLREEGLPNRAGFEYKGEDVRDVLERLAQDSPIEGHPVLVSSPGVYSTVLSDTSDISDRDLDFDSQSDSEDEHDKAEPA